jgi:hypothetical protein
MPNQKSPENGDLRTGRNVQSEFFTQPGEDYHEDSEV